MKFIIIGLGQFGSSLAEKLTNMGHEVIGVDKDIDKVELVKDKVTNAICVDCSNQDSVSNLPLKNTDVVVVGIGEDEGANLLATALLKRMNVPRLISRSVSQIHETILEAMEVNEIVRPEEETAERWAKKLTATGMLDSFELTDNYSIVEVKVPAKFAGRTIGDIGFNRDYSVIVLTIMKNVKGKSILGLFRKAAKLTIEGVATAHTVLQEDDVMVLFGCNEDIRRLVE